MSAAVRTAGSSSGRLYARLALLCGAAAIAVAVVAGVLKAITAVFFVLLALAVALAGGWWFLSRRGIGRLFGAVLAVGAPLGLLAILVWRYQLWAVLLFVVLCAAALALGRTAMLRARPETGMPEAAAPPPRQPFLIMNPRSGGGKVGRFDLDGKARALGAEVALLDGPVRVDVTELARHAVAGGADLLGVAGGDGTQALVAGIAADSALPFVVISAGTRNHFAMDLGLDRDQPDAGLEALSDGVEVRLDLGDINGRTFVNNASFGAYADIVQSPAYRDDKRGTTLQMLPDLLVGQHGPRLTVHVDDTLTVESPQAVLVSNGPYELNDFAGLGRRARLDTGTLGVIIVSISSAAEAAGLLRGRRGSSVRSLTAHEVVVEADAGTVPVGIDGEALLLRTPVRCTIRPAVLRVRLPRNRPGARPATPALDPAVLVHEAIGRS